MHFCHEELLAVVSAIQQVFPTLAIYITRLRAWWHTKRVCYHADQDKLLPGEHRAVK